VGTIGVKALSLWYFLVSFFVELLIGARYMFLKFSKDSTLFFEGSMYCPIEEHGPSQTHPCLYHVVLRCSVAGVVFAFFLEEAMDSSMSSSESANCAWWFRSRTILRVPWMYLYERLNII
jgi:hypothetical protein